MPLQCVFHMFKDMCVLCRSCFMLFSTNVSFCHKYDKYMTKMANVQICVRFGWVFLETTPSWSPLFLWSFRSCYVSKDRKLPTTLGYSPVHALEQSNLHFTWTNMTLRFRFAIVAIFMMWSPNTCTPLPVVYGLIHIQWCYSIGQVTSCVLGRIRLTYKFMNAHHNFCASRCWESYHMKHPPPLRYTYLDDRESREIESR